ncbi:MAG: transcription termination factor Rho [Actinomycetota bacterium]
METAEMRRSTLQRKDRDELTQIATTLGKKPSSRARKGEIIDLILDLAAGGDGNGAADADAASTETNTPAADASATEADASDADADAETGDPDSGNRDSGDRDSGDRAEAPDASSDTDNRPEPGNRRRRRRGRDRDNRNESNEQWDGDPIPAEGRLDLRSEGYGFLRVNGYIPSRDDAYVPVKLVRQYGLRKGDVIAGPSRPANRNEKNPALMSVETVNGAEPDAATARPDFDDLVAIHPAERLTLERGDGDDTAARLIDLVAPIGKGQRGLIVAPPRSGKSTVMNQIIRSVRANHADADLIVLLIDERPEEVTAMTRALGANGEDSAGEVVASGFDRPADEHVHIADLAIERAKRLVEDGRDVVVLVDGITRLARAYATETPPSNKTLPGGLDAAAMIGPKQLLAAARNIDEGGSLTILATASADNGNDVDEAILAELLGAVNLELRLDRALADRRAYPAIDVAGSATRHEDSLLDAALLDQIVALRRHLADRVDTSGGPAAHGELLALLAGTTTNDEFLREVGKSTSAS